MLGLKKIGSVKNLAKMVRVRGEPDTSQSEWLLRNGEPKEEDDEVRTNMSSSGSSSSSSSSCKTPIGFFTVYIGEERRRFIIPMSYLSHPLFKMMLEKSSEEFGFNQKNGLVVPCSVNAFQEVVSVVESCNGKFDLSHLVQELV